MGTKHWWWIGLLALWTASLPACGASRAGEGGQPAAAAPATQASGAKGGDPAKQPLDLKALMAREVADLTPTPAQADFVKARVLARAQVRGSADKNAAKLEIPIGAQANVTCVAHREDPDAGAMLNAILSGLKKVGEVRHIQLLPVGVIKEAPVLSLVVLYTVRRPGGNMVGELKLMHHSRLDHSSLCFHDEVGYRASFARVARSFFESQDRGAAARESSFVEIQLAHVNDVPAGFDKVEIFRDQAGNRKIVTLSLLLLLRSPTDLIALDSATIITVDASGMVLDGRYVRVENARSTLDLKLRRAAGKKYEFAGTAQGKPISGSFPVKDGRGLPSSLHDEKRIADGFRAGRAFSFKSESYDPDSDPTKPKLVEYRHDQKDPTGLVRVKLDESEMSGIADELGRMQEGKLQLGALTIQMKRAFLRGSP
jgi:hypothetical protein